MHQAAVRSKDLHVLLAGALVVVMQRADLSLGVAGEAVAGSDAGMGQGFAAQALAFIVDGLACQIGAVFGEIPVQHIGDVVKGEQSGKGGNKQHPHQLQERSVAIGRAQMHGSTSAAGAAVILCLQAIMRHYGTTNST